MTIELRWWSQSSLATVIACLLGVGLGIANVRGDELVLAPTTRTVKDASWYPKPLIRERCEIRSIDRSRCEYVRADGHLTTIASHRVIAAVPESKPEAQVQWLEIWSRQERAVAERDLETLRSLDAELVKKLLPALRTRPPIWRQQWLIAVTTRSLFRLGRAKTAYDLIKQLDDRSLPPMAIAELPIAGFHGGLEDDLGSGATVSVDAENLGSDSPSVRLVAASRLLGSPKRADALAELKRLGAIADRPSIVVSARMLLLSVAPRPDLQSRVGDAKRQLERIPIVLRGGPTRRLATVYRRYSLTNVAVELEAIADAL